MVLDSDCVRDVLLAVENCSFGERITLNFLEEKLPDYSEEQLWYTCIKLNEGGYLDVLTVDMLRMPLPGIKQINGLTYQGHEFLDTVRENKIWAKTKDLAKRSGVFSLKLLGEIAQSVASAAITSALRPHP